MTLALNEKSQYAFSLLGFLFYVMLRRNQPDVFGN